MTLDYFYGQVGELFSFYRIPKALFLESRFQNLSTDAKTLYGILLDRMSLSAKNGWLDEQGRVFIIFTIEDVKRALCCADNKATKLLRELEEFGLIERKRRGLGRPSLVYVKNFSAECGDSENRHIDNRIVCFDIKQLGKQLKKLGMLIVQDQVWGRVTANRSVGKSTRYYADEFHLLLKDEQTAAYSVEIWKRFRKWGGIPTALTQNVKDLLASPEVSNIFENSDFVYMLNQANGDRQILAKQLNISPHQLSYVTHSGEGEGLLFFGNVILPFVDHFPKDLELYRILTTRLSEVVEAKHE